MRFNLPFRLRLPRGVHREAVIIAGMAALASVFWVGVTALSELYQSQQNELSERWASRGETDLKSAKYKEAVEDFHSALRYSHDDYAQQLGLAQSLVGMNRTGEAAAYLETLWEQEPENGLVNRELARIAAGKGDVRQALRYYHNAIYASWQSNADAERRDTRWELIKYLIKMNAKAQAQSELISLSADVGDDPAPQIDLGEYFLRVGDPSHALAAFELRLKANPRNAEALAGAGAAAFDTAQYPLAQRYLKEAAEERPGDRDIVNRLQVVEAAVHLNPYRRDISDTERKRVTISAFDAAGERLKACAAIGNEAYNGKTLAAAWKDMKPHVNASELARVPDAVNRAMNLVFEVERQANAKCGAGSPSDAALLLISGAHEGN
jgi:tetratricopeptide (TPR) repeat protein